jgi:GDP-L-fucose synthase
MREDALLTGSLEYTNEPYAIAKIAGIKMCESYNVQYGTNFISVMPTNLYGPNDNFDLETSHVLPALLRKMILGKYLQNNDLESVKSDLEKRPIEGVNHTASDEQIMAVLDKYGIRETAESVEVEIWGTGAPMREFLYSEDMADACVHIMERVDFKDTYDNSQKEVRNTHINIGTAEEISIKELAETIQEIVGFKGKLYFNTLKPDGTMRKLTSNTKATQTQWKHQTSLEEGISRIITSI